MNNKKILIIDDNPINCKAVSEILRKAGYEAFTADNSKDALSLIGHQSDIALIVMDIELNEEKDGIDLAGDIQKNRQIPVVFYTSHQDRETLSRIKEVSAYGYIMKESAGPVIISQIEMALKLFRTNQLLRQSEDQNRNLVNSSLDHVFILDFKGNYVMSNSKYHHFGQEDSISFEGMNLSDVMNEEETRFYKERLQEVIETGKAVTFEHTLTVGDEVLYHKDTLYPLNKDGKISSVGGICRDISAEKMKERILSESEERFRTLFDVSPVPIVIHKNGKFILVNRAAFSVLEMDESTDLSKLSPIDFVHPDDKAYALERIKQLYAGGQTVPEKELRFITGRQRVLIVKAQSRLISINKDTVVFTVLQDLTDIRKAEEQLRILSTAIEQNSACIVITDHNGTIQYVNPRFTETTGYSREEALGQNPRVLKSGEQSDDYYRTLWETIASGKVWSGEFHNRKKNNETYWESAIISPIKNEQGIVTHYVAIKENITQRKAAEQALQQSLEDMKSYSHVLAHDLREPVRMVSQFLQMLRKQSSALLDSQALELLDYALEGSKRIDDMIQALFEFTTLEAKKNLFEPVDLNLVLKSVLDNISLYIREKNAVIQSEKLPVVRGQKELLGLVFQNLIGNALKFSKKDLPPLVEIKAAENQLEYIILVKDNGIGINSKNFNKLFYLFQRLHNESEFDGLGIGLATCRKIIERHGGKIRLESELGKGTEFYISFPKT